VARVDKRLRTGKVLVDWGQNDRHKSTVAPYSLRAKLARPTVSLPVTWEALTSAVDAASADALLPSPEQALERVAETGDLFASVLTLAQQLPG
jgi:bifunctional non-homologous end joining protein LigD